MLTLRAPLDDAAREALARELAPLHMLEAVVRWAFAQSPPRMIEDVVVQDEFTHDVVLAWREGLYLVFDTT